MSRFINEDIQPLALLLSIQMLLILMDFLTR